MAKILSMPASAPAPTPVSYTGQFGTVTRGNTDTKNVGVMPRSGQLTGEVNVQSDGRSVEYFPVKITINGVDTAITMTTVGALQYQGLVSVSVNSGDIVTIALSNTVPQESTATATGSWSLELN